MKALWWFKDQAIVGMARPGFNLVHLSDFPIDEGILFGWLGQYSAGPAPLQKFRSYLKTYAPKVFPFFKLSRERSEGAMQVFDDEKGILSVVQRLAERTDVVGDSYIADDHLYFAIREARIRQEAGYLRSQGVKKVVCLTELHHNESVLSDYFDLHHIAIADLHAPSMEQVSALAEIIKNARRNNEVVAVHCLAGIGRTPTMLLAAHVLLGEPLDELWALLSERNPKFVLSADQRQFVGGLLSALGGEHGEAVRLLGIGSQA